MIQARLPVPDRLSWSYRLLQSFPCPSSSASLASGAPPTPFSRSRGFPRRAWLTELTPREFLSWSSAPLQSSTASYPPVSLLRSSSLARSGSFPGLGSASPGVLAPLETQLHRVPLLARTALWPSGKTKVAKPSSEPSSGFLPLSTVLAALAALHELLRARRYAVAPRCFAALLHAARVSLELPFRAFPSRGAVPALAGLCFRAGSHPTTASAAWSSLSRSLSPPRQLFARSPPGGEPRRMSRDDGFLRPLSWSPVSHSRVASRPAFPFTT